MYMVNNRNMSSVHIFIVNSYVGIASGRVEDSGQTWSPVADRGETGFWDGVRGF